MISGSESLTEALRPVYEYWAARCRRDTLPARDDIDPIDLAPYLPNLCLIDVDAASGHRRYRYRLVGTGVVDRMGTDCTGQHFDEVFDADSLATIVARYDSCVDSGQPVHSHESVPIHGREFLRYDRLLLPLAADGRRVDTLLVAYEFEN